MMIRLLVASSDREYADFLLKVLSENYKGIFELMLCSSMESYRDMAERKSFDIVLADASMVEAAQRNPGKMAAYLWEDEAEGVAGTGCARIRKYQRVSKIASALLEEYAKAAEETNGCRSGCSRVTAVWSPVGGCGKTTVAMAYAAAQASQGKRAIYLDMEHFSTTPAYFKEQAKSISSLFEALDGKANLEVLAAGLAQKDSGSGILYFGIPNNYDDMNILSVENLDFIVKACASQCEELIIDLPSICDERGRHLLEISDHVLAVYDGTRNGAVKWEQFKSQNNLFGKLQDKMQFVANKGAQIGAAGRAVALPLVQSNDPVAVYMALSIHKLDGA